MSKELTQVSHTKRIYAFGDSIVYGHTAPKKSFMELIARETDIDLTMCAKNGATVIPGSGNDIITQIKNAPTLSPDIVVFDGYTNDAYAPVMEKLGSPKGCNATEFDNTTFAGAFEEIIYTIKQKWGKPKIVYVTVHKSAARDWAVQCALHNMTTSICKEWGVNVADVFANSSLDTRDGAQMTEYIIGKSGSHPNEKGCKRFYMPIVKKSLT